MKFRKYIPTKKERRWSDGVNDLVKKNGGMSEQEQDEVFRKIRRQIEDFLRKTKDKRWILKVADILGIYYDKSISKE